MSAPLSYLFRSGQSLLPLSFAVLLLASGCAGSATTEQAAGGAGTSATTTTNAAGTGTGAGTGTDAAGTGAMADASVKTARDLLTPAEVSGIVGRSVQLQGSMAATGTGTGTDAGTGTTSGSATGTATGTDMATGTGSTGTEATGTGTSDNMAGMSNTAVFVEGNTGSSTAGSPIVTIALAGENMFADVRDMGKTQGHKMAELPSIGQGAYYDDTEGKLVVRDKGQTLVITVPGQIQGKTRQQVATQLGRIATGRM